MMRNIEMDTRPTNEAKVVMVSRLLTHDNRARLLEWAYLACAAENSIRKLCHSESATNSILPGKRRGIPANAILRD